jgi:peroxiredoxin
LVVGILAIGALFVARQQRQGPALTRGMAAPEFTLPDLHGQQHTLSGLRGKVAVLNFWATWCPPCVEEMPSLDGLHKALAPEGLVVLGISVDEDASALRRFVQERGIGLTVLHDPGGRQAATAYGVRGFPETVVVGPDGLVIESYRGPARWDTPEALSHFRELLARFKTSPTR